MNTLDYIGRLLDGRHNSTAAIPNCESLTFAELARIVVAFSGLTLSLDHVRSWAALRRVLELPEQQWVRARIREHIPVYGPRYHTIEGRCMIGDLHTFIHRVSRAYSDLEYRLEHQSYYTLADVKASVTYHADRLVEPEEATV